MPLAPHLSVTFSQPMVAVDFASRRSRSGTCRCGSSPKRRASGAGSGRARSCSSPSGRFPMATEYRATVPAGREERRGRDARKRRVVELQDAAAAARRRAIPRAVPCGATRSCSRPSTSASTRPPCSRACACARAARCSAARGSRRAAEVEQDETVARLARAAEPGRWLAFRTEQPLPPDATVEVSVGPGTPSAEGPRKSETAERWSFRSYGPFRVRNSECGWNGRCTPFDPWRIELTQPDRREDARQGGACASSPSCRGSSSRAGATRSRPRASRRAHAATASRSRARSTTPSARRSSPARRSRSP